MSKAKIGRGLIENLRLGRGKKGELRGDGGDEGPAKGYFAKDLMASVVVFLVALPLCLGVAVASGVPPALGLITGIVGGLVVGSIAGQPLQVSGPAAGLTVLIWELVNTHGLGVLGASVLFAGAVQIVMGLFGLGRWFQAISPAVIQGMLAGIGVLIISGQVLVMLDFSPEGSGLANLAAIPGDLWMTVVPHDGGTNQHVAALSLGLLALAVLIAWGYVPGKFKMLPGPLVAIVAVVLLDVALDIPTTNVSIEGNLLDAVQLTTPAVVGEYSVRTIVTSGLAIALIASAETLLCASAVDKMHDGPRTRYNRELVAQGIGNSVCGFFGALPMTGVIVRSKANVDAGAKTRRSAMLHGVWILGFVALLPFVLEAIPVAALAAILVHTGYKLIAPGSLRNLWHVGKAEVAIFAVTLVSVVVLNLLEGVLIGLGLALLKLLWEATPLKARVQEVRDEEEEGDLTVSMEGAATFVRLPQLAETLESVPQGSKVHLKTQDLGLVDHAGYEMISNWKKQHEAQGGEVIVEQNEHGFAADDDTQERKGQAEPEGGLR